MCRLKITVHALRRYATTTTICLCCTLDGSSSSRRGKVMGATAVDDNNKTVSRWITDACIVAYLCAYCSIDMSHICTCVSVCVCVNIQCTIAGKNACVSEIIDYRQYRWCAVHKRSSIFFWAIDCFSITILKINYFWSVIKIIFTFIILTFDKPLI